ncbi:LD-carboxypeptidase superfamily [Synechococcus sp. PCC 7335]|uniref:S66 peptidase family protein n=1 Tax=Synechococcus sp. (strain ATCC 29403 / PCC 7335) TaxID=91464 RepID=UPI00017EC72F|nr:LD-carboxypeptidase [Synechococcus sp. PCC 7335]EDX85877.1 LD-carboxypeptidase superfamily [Synechococcus sp. PCC 7335]
MKFAHTICQLPPALVPGDLLCVISPSGGLQSTELFEEGLAIWRQRGYKIHLSPGYDHSWGYLAGTDEQRRSQLLTALNNPECKGILCSRGGYGGTRLLEDWQWPQASLAQGSTNQETKWLIGFSDITSLLWSLSRQGVAGVHGPVLTTLAAEPTESIERLFALVEQHQIRPLQGRGWAQRGCGGVASGALLPGNLCVSTHLLGTEAEPNLTDVILAFEDVGEAPYRLDRMLTQWRSMGRFDGVKGIALGRFSGCEPTKPGPTLSVEAVMCDRLADLQIPIVSGLPFGHDGENAAMPVGLSAKLDADSGVLSWPMSTKGDRL